MESFQRPTVRLNQPTAAPITFSQFGNPLPFSPAEMAFMKPPLLGGGLGGGGGDDLGGGDFLGELIRPDRDLLDSWWFTDTLFH